MFARTPRLMLRPGWVEDAPALARAIGHECVVAKLATAPWPYALGDAEQFLARPMSLREPFLLIFDRPDSTPRLVGGIGINRAGASYELGYWIAPDAWGRGYATEAGHAMVSIARVALGLRRLQADHFVDNPASGRVLHKLGFTPTGQVVPRHSRARGREVLSVSYALDLDTEAAMPIAA